MFATSEGSEITIRVREMGYADYGFGDGEEKDLKNYCRKIDLEEKELLLQCATSANPYIAKELCQSLVEGKSYEELCKKQYIPLPKSDFYGYQRKCLALFRNFLLFYRKWV